MKSAFAALLLCLAAAPTNAAPALPLDGFADGIHHWQNSHHSTDYPRLAEDEVREIADNILLYQRENGGWRENEDPLRILSAEEKRQIAAERPKADTSFDNRNIWPQIEYLAGAYRMTGDTRYREACLRGIDFTLSAQHASGGFPHSFPSEEGFHPYLTFADDVIPDALRALRKIASGRKPFDFIDDACRDRAANAVVRGDACVLHLQIRQNGQRTAWAGQYNPVTLAPAGARAFELPALVSRESVAVVRYLMSIERPSTEMIESVEGAVAWFRRVQIDGLRLETFEAEPVNYRWHTSTTDRRTVPDPTAPPLWARFYDLETSEPFLAGRNGQRVQTLAEVERERRSGYDWYGIWPADLLANDYPAWKTRIGK